MKSQIVQSSTYIKQNIYSFIINAIIYDFETSNEDSFDQDYTHNMNIKV